MNLAIALNPDEQRELGAGFQIDSNRQGMAERLMEQIADGNPFEDIAWIAQEAVRTAEANLPTRREAAQQIAQLRDGPAYCYLAFHGLDGLAQFVKVGMTRHPERRLYGMATGNPLDCLWVYVCRAPTVALAYGMEQALLRRMSDRKRRGEWITLGAVDADAAASLARSCGEFELLGYTDGR